MKAEPKPRISGFCNVTLPRTKAYDPHQNCRGCDCRAPGCPCNPETHMTALDPGDFAHNDELAHADDAPHDELPDTPEAAVSWIRSAVDSLNTAMKGYNPEDWTDAVRLLHELRKPLTLLRTLDATLSTWIYLHGEHGLHITVEGVPGEVTVGRGRKKERWAGAEAVQEYVGRRIEELGGEMPDPETVIEWVLEVVPAASCRVTPLRDVGIDVNDYRTSEPGTITIGTPRPALT